MQDGADIKVMDALVQPTGLEQTQNQCVTNDSGGTWIRMGGAFFNSTPITGTVDGQLNDIQAHIALYAGMQIPPIPPVLLILRARVYRCTR